LLGVLNVESRQENAFSSQDVLIMSTLADLLATALHNTFVFQKLQQQSITDGLTGIKTRRFFWEALSSEWKRASRSGRPFSVVLIDLDKFKDVNDTFGHLEGDLVLARVGRLLEQRCRQSNVVARYGGDEFVILMPETSIDQAHALAERLRLWLAQDAMLAEHHISGSFGVASFPAHGFSAEDIIRVADAGMYSAKHSGGNRVSMVEEFGDGENIAAQRQQLSTYIEGFLQKDRTRPKDLEDLTSTLHRLCGDDCNVQVLKESIEALARAGESREFHASGHGEMVGRYSEMIGRALALPPDELVELVYAAKVHDVGKIFVPEHIITKQGTLNEEEFAQIKEHARIGAEIVATIPGSVMLQKAVEHHHEAFDGSGYPNGLRGEEIPLWARIVALADAFVNMTTERGFAAAKTTEQALAEIEKLSGTRYDGMLVRVLLRQLKTGKAPSLGD
jgi:diguanylate cyclase (GGDEF)-like protein